MFLFNKNALLSVTNRKQAIVDNCIALFLKRTEVACISLFLIIGLAGCEENAVTADMQIHEICYRGQYIMAELISGVYYVEGDLEVTDHEWWCPDDGLSQTDGFDGAESTRRRERRALLGDPDWAGAPWPGGVVPYVIDGTFAIDHRNAIIAAMDEWQMHVKGLSFREKIAQDQSWIYFEQTDNTCSSGFGSVLGARNVRLATAPDQETGAPHWCITTYSIHHEIGHALGLLHQHTRSDRDNYVSVMYNKIDDGRIHDYEIEDAAGDLFDYDFDSVMHYPLGEKLVAIAPVPGGVNVGQRTHLSALDIKSVNAMYPVLRIKDTVFVAPNSEFELCRLEGRDEDAATRFTMLGSNLGPFGIGMAQSMGNGIAKYHGTIGTRVLSVSCLAESKFWSEGYSYPNMDSSRFYESDGGAQKIAAVNTVRLLSAGLIPILF